MLVRQVPDLQRFDDPVHDERRAQAGPQTQKQHAPALVTAHRLHRGIIDDTHRLTESFREIESDPAPAQIVRFRRDPAANDQSRIADRQGVVAPVRRQLAHLAHHFPRAHFRPRIEAQHFALPEAQLDMGAANVEDEDLACPGFDSFHIRPGAGVRIFAGFVHGRHVRRPGPSTHRILRESPVLWEL